MKHIYSFLAVMVIGAFAFAGNGAVTTVVTHNYVTVVTNPSSGSNEYKAWGVFPSGSVKYRKVNVNLAYKCPQGMTCGEWDYIDRLMLRRKGGVSRPSEDIELVRFITPYGLSSNFNSSWSFDWDMDITDFSTFLHDSVEIGYIHTGYETSVGRGWSVKVTFTITEGTPICETLEMDRLWSGSYPYGSATYSINDSLAAKTIPADNNAELITFRLNHTGHGSDADYCSEFCDKYRILYYDGAGVDTVRRWRKCGINELYPQGGTWVYDRGNWCPGSIVYPYLKQFPLSAEGSHTLKIGLESHSGDGSAREDITAYAFRQKKPTDMDDVALLDVMNPTSKKVYLRMNPTCAAPRVIVRNAGKNRVEQINFRYYLDNQPELFYYYHCNIPSLGIDTVTLPYTMVPNMPDQLFVVYVTSVNNQTPGFPYDDTLRTVTNTTASPLTSLLDTTVVLHIRTNVEGNEVGYKIFDGEGNVVYQRAVGSMASSTLYTDTMNLFPGCYKMEVYDVDDSGGDGLGFWANSAAGTGQLWLKRKNGQIIKIFPTDYGAITRMSFTVGGVSTEVPIDMAVKELPYTLAANLYPNPAGEYFIIDISCTESDNFQFQLFDVEGKLVHSAVYSNTPGISKRIATSSFARGIYIAKITGSKGVVQRKLILD